MSCENSLKRSNTWLGRSENPKEAEAASESNEFWDQNASFSRDYSASVKILLEILPLIFKIFFQQGGTKQQALLI